MDVGDAQHRLEVGVGTLVFPAQGRQLLALGTGQSTVATRPGVPLGLAYPLPDCGLAQIEVAGDLPDRAVTPLAQLDDLGLELGA